MLKLYVKTQTAGLKVRDLMRDIKENEEGASLIEYSLLIGLISAAVVAIIVAVGNKIVPYWKDLNSAMPG